MLDIRLLGPPLVYLNGELITVRRRATRALLFYLAAHGKPIGREQLAELFWPEKTDEKQRRQLRDLLNKLRRILPDSEFVQTHQDTISLDFEQVSVDLREYEDLILKAGNLPRIWQEDRPLPVHIYQQLTKAVELWHGSVFHNADMSVSYRLEEWWTQTAQNLEQGYISVLKSLIRHENIVSADEKALQLLRTALEIDGFDEELHYELLICLLKIGQPEKVQQHYIGVKTLFDKKLGVPLSERIRSLEPVIFQKTEASPSHVRPAWSIKSSLEAPFVGQQDSIQILKDSYLKGNAALILGEAGAGKTRLVKEFYQSLEVSPRLLVLSCNPTDENLPYRPWADMLRREISEETWEELPDMWLEPLAMLLPKLRKGKGDLTEELETPYANSFIFEAIKNLLSLISKETPCILFVDDAHWADEATLSLLTFLVEQSVFLSQTLSLIITARIEEKNSGIDQLLLGAIRNRIELIEMLRLNTEDISDLAFYLFEEKLSPEIATRFLRDTGGNPFFVLEMLSAYRESSEKGRVDFHLPIPASMKALIEMRVKKLSPLAREVLILAAIQGSPFDFSLLEKAAALSLELMAHIIEELEEAQLIQKTSDKNDLEFRFVHEKIREILIASLPIIKSRLLHKKVARALEEIGKKGQDTQAAILAELYEQAGEFSLAFDLWVQAGKDAYYLLSIKDATTAYKRAEALINTRSLQDKQIYDLYASWQIMLFQNDDANALEEIMQAFFSIGKERTSKLLIGAALDGMSDVHMVRNEFEEGLARVDEALPYLKGELTVAEMNAEIHRGVFLYMRSQFQESQEPIRKALHLGENAQDLDILAASGHANYQMAVIWIGTGWPAKGIESGMRSLRELTLSRAINGPVIAHSIMGLGHYFLANYEKGKEHSLKAVRLAKQVDSWRMLGYGYSYAGMNETELASFGTAWEYAHKAIEIGENHGHTEIVSMGYKVLGDINTRLGALPKAATFYKFGVDADEGSFAKLENLARLGVTLSLLGDPKGDALLQQAYAYSQAAGLDTILLNAKALELSVFLSQNNLTAFEENLPKVRQTLIEHSHPDSFVWTDYLQALSLFRHGKTEQALKEIEDLLLAFNKTPFFWIKLRALKLHGQMLHALGRETNSPSAQLEEMLQKVESNLGNAPLEEEWQNFRKKMRAFKYKQEK